MQIKTLVLEIQAPLLKVSLIMHMKKFQET